MLPFSKPKSHLEPFTQGSQKKSLQLPQQKHTESEPVCTLSKFIHGLVHIIPSGYYNDLVTQNIKKEMSYIYPVNCLFTVREQHHSPWKLGMVHSKDQDIFCKDSDSNYFRLCGLFCFSHTTEFCCCGQKTAIGNM